MLVVCYYVLVIYIFFGLFDLDDESCSFRVIFSIGGFSCRKIFSNSIDCSFLSCNLNRNRCF